MKISSNDIPGVSRVLEVALAREASPTSILERLDQAISGVYRPQGRWSERECDIAFLVKALGGPRLLYTLQKSHHFPSASSLRVRKTVPQLVVSCDRPSAGEIDANLHAMLHLRPPPPDVRIGQTLMLDGVALEEVARYCSSRNMVVGLCCADSAKQKKILDEYADLDAMKAGLDSEKFHLAKEGAMFVVGPVSARENYYPTPIALFGACKAETGTMLADITRLLIEQYDKHPSGRSRHGNIVLFCTDGDASFRAARFLLCLKQPAISGADTLAHLTGLNTLVGTNELIGCCDPKHVIKRFAQALRSYTLRLEIGDTTITYQDIKYALSVSGTPEDRIAALLNPQDKQNVPIALDLLMLLRNAEIPTQSTASPGDRLRVERVRLYAKIVSYFVEPFTTVTMGLAEQVEKLSTYAHLVFSLYRSHRQHFMKGALYADSMSIVKAVMLLVARYQTADPGIVLYITEIGTDREEGVFSQVRTQDHARNCDILQLGQKASIGAEVNRIYNTYPDLYSGHKRRAIGNSGTKDHINPASFPSTTNLTVGSVNLPHCYSHGCDHALDIIHKRLGMHISLDCLKGDDIDILRPFGKYVGSSLESSEGGLIVDLEANDDEDMAVESTAEKGTLPPGQNEPSAEPDVLIFQDVPEEILGAEQDDLGADSEDPDSESTSNLKLIVVDGKSYHKSTLVPKLLSSSSSRKVTIRQFRAAGMTVRDIAQRTTSSTRSSQVDSSSHEGHLFNKDLVAFLFSSTGRSPAGGHSESIALAVMEIVHFQAGSSSRIKFDIPLDELETSGMKVVGQIIDLQSRSTGDFTLGDSGSMEPRLTWSGAYLTVTSSSTGAGAASATTPGNSSQQLITVPGSMTYPLVPEVRVVDGKHTWVIAEAALQSAATDLWECMEPTTGDILVKLEGLPRIASPKLPYTCKDRTHLVVRGAAAHIVSKLGSDESVQCLWCDFQCPLKHLRNHVGLHILRAARNIEDTSLTSPNQVSRTHLWSFRHPD